MIKTSGLVMSLALTGLVVAGQLPVTSYAQSESDDTATRLDILERQVQARQEGMSRMNRLLNRLEGEISELRGVAEEHGYQIEQILERQRDLYQEIDRLRSDMQATGAGMVEPETDDDVRLSADRSENEQYDQAVQLVLEERRYDDAIVAFERFLESYPDSGFRSNALYWLGQLHYAQQDYEAARPYFEEVVSEHPDSNKRADCMLKLGIMAAAEDDQQAASRWFERVGNEYPDTTEASLARDRLDNLN